MVIDQLAVVPIVNSNLIYELVDNSQSSAWHVFQLVIREMKHVTREYEKKRSLSLLAISFLL